MPNQPLTELTKHEYETLKSSGMLWEFHPEATGDWANDCAGPRADQAFAAFWAMCRRVGVDPLEEVLRRKGVALSIPRASQN